MQIIIGCDQLRNIQLHGAAGTAVPARGTGNCIFHPLRQIHQRLVFFFVQRLFGLERLHVLDHLLVGGHAAQDHLHIRQSLQKPERPVDTALLRTKIMKDRLLFLREIGQSSAAQRFHDPHRDPAFGEKVILLFRILQCPVQVVQLDLTEFHFISAVVQEFFQCFRMRVAGKTQVADASQFLLFHKIIQNPPPLIHIGLDGVFVHVVQKIEIKILYPAFFQLLFKDCSGIIGIADLVPGIFRCQIKGLSRMPCQCLSQNDLRIAGMIRKRRVKIIDPVLQCVIHHLEHLFLIDFRGIGLHHRKTHCSESKP